jgi:hypothetical protein
MLARSMSLISLSVKTRDGSSATRLAAGFCVGRCLASPSSNFSLPPRERIKTRSMTFPSFLDNQMHDLHVERFLKGEVGDGPIKSFTLRGIKDSPPYLHDGRCLTLEDTVEFFNLVLELKLTKDEKQDLVAFLRQL